MSKLLTEDLRRSLPKFREQENSQDPIVYAVFFFPASGWTWYVTEGQQEKDDFLFFGYVIGLESEWGYFALSELEEVEIHGLKIERVFDFAPSPLSKLKSVKRGG